MQARKIGAVPMLDAMSGCSVRTGMSKERKSRRHFLAPMPSQMEHLLYRTVFLMSLTSKDPGMREFNAKIEKRLTE